jgi:hypothetical protein
MTEGKIVAEGLAENILTNSKLVQQASVVPPEITRLFQGLTEFGLPKNVIDVHEAGRILLNFLEGGL